MSSLPEPDDPAVISPDAISGVENYPGITREAWEQTEKTRKDTTRNLASFTSRVNRARERHSHSPPSKLRSVLSETSGTSMRTRYSLLQIIHAAQPVSRVELARRLGIKRSRVSEIINPLLAAGVCRETSFEQVSGRLGRPPVGLSLCAEWACFVGVSIGVSHTHLRAVSADGDVLAEEGFDTPADPMAAIAAIHSAIERLRAEARFHNLSAIGVSVPGSTDAGRTRLLHAPHLGWRDLAIADLLRFHDTQRMTDSVPIIVETDATAAAVYEGRRRLRVRSGGVGSDFVVVRVGNGIGVGLVLGDEVYRSCGVGEGLACDFGHMTIAAGGKLCACGNRGCWERYASAPSVGAFYAGRRQQVRDARLPPFTEIVLRAEGGEVRAQRALQRVGAYLGIGISNVILTLGVTDIVVTGAILDGWRFIKEPVREAMAKTLPGRLARWSVEAGEPAGAGIGGAVAVAVAHYLLSLASQMSVAA